MPELGHMAYYVRNLERSVAFYEKVVGLTVVGRIFSGRAAILSGGRSHHELLLIQVSTADGPLVGRRIGLYHAGWKVGDSLAELKEALDRAQLYGYNVDSTTDHGMMFSIYLRDPDDNEVELFVDDPEYDWRMDKSWMETPVKPLDISTCLVRTGRPRVKPSKVAEKPKPVPRTSPYPVREERVHQPPPREFLQTVPLTVPAPPQGQVPIPTKAEQLLLHTRLNEGEADKAGGTVPAATPRQPTGEPRSAAPLEQPRSSSEPQAIKVASNESERKQGQGPQPRPLQNPNEVSTTQPTTTMGYGDIMQSAPPVNRQFDADMFNAPPSASGEQPPLGSSSYAREDGREAKDLSRPANTGESPYPIENAAA